MDPQQHFLLFGITPQAFTPAQLNCLNDLFSAGLDYLYIRSGAGGAAAWQELLRRIDPAFYGRLLLPGNAPANAAGGKYIRHIRERERPFRPGGEQGGPPAAFSTSVHQLATVPQLPGIYQFVFYSPLFPSVSKPGYQPQLGLETVARQLAGLRPAAGLQPRIIGLGGVQAGNIARVKAAGFQGAALLGALWQNESPLQALAEIRSRIHAD
jgi:thiamine-phosphate pyrophosphorylase